ncbi:hypothetical protein L1887_18086 [Cichorium endivia]|nr:hypothetical protein L1887_18086 [Cichorium endivia]
MYQSTPALSTNVERDLEIRSITQPWTTIEKIEERIEEIRIQSITQPSTTSQPSTHSMDYTADRIQSITHDGVALNVDCSESNGTVERSAIEIFGRMADIEKETWRFCAYIGEMICDEEDGKGFEINQFLCGASLHSVSPQSVSLTIVLN